MQTTEKKLKKNMAIIVALVVCLLITTIALAMSIVDIKNNQYQTGLIKININNGESILNSDKPLYSLDGGYVVDISKIEPGMTLVAPFFVKNEGTFSVYYKLYFKDVRGALANVLEIEIREKTENGEEGALVCSGTPMEMAMDPEMQLKDDVLDVSEQKDLLMYVHFPEEAGNEAQSKELEFSMAVDAVQTKNNPDKEYTPN